MGQLEEHMGKTVFRAPGLDKYVTCGGALEDAVAAAVEVARIECRAAITELSEPKAAAAAQS